MKKHENTQLVFEAPAMTNRHKIMGNIRHISWSNKFHRTTRTQTSRHCRLARTQFKLLYQCVYVYFLQNPQINGICILLALATIDKSKAPQQQMCAPPACNSVVEWWKIKIIHSFICICVYMRTQKHNEISFYFTFHRLRRQRGYKSRYWRRRCLPLMTSCW